MGNTAIIQKNKKKIDNYYVKQGNESRKNSFSDLQKGARTTNRKDDYQAWSASYVEKVKRDWPSLIDE